MTNGEYVRQEIALTSFHALFLRSSEKFEESHDISQSEWSVTCSKFESAISSVPYRHTNLLYD